MLERGRFGDGKNIIHYAVMAQEVAVVKLLLSRGIAKKELRDFTGKLPRAFANSVKMRSLFGGT